MALIKKKGTCGAVSNYINRRQALKKLQISLQDFRRLCILKGIYPREPNNKKKVNKGSTAPTTWYYRRDIQFLLHEPLLDKFREWKIFARKMTRVLAKQQWAAAESLEESKPDFNIDHIIRERYPSFNDALNDMDDAITMVFLFASMPSDAIEQRQKLVENCQRKSVEFMNYVVYTRSLRKTFISIKGIYYQAEIRGQVVTWVVPHQFKQEPPTDVDFKVMYTFLQLYDTLLGFILYKLYTDVNLKYPPVLDASMDAQDCGLSALRLEDNATSIDSKPKSTHSVQLTAEQRKKLKTLSSSLQNMQQEDGNDADSPARPQEKSDDEDCDACEDEFDAPAENAQPAEDEADILTRPLVTYKSLTESVSSKQNLFNQLVFYISREVPRSSVEFVIRSFGGIVGWDSVLGGSSPLDVKDSRITHHIVDRPMLAESYSQLPPRSFVQPQWVFDSVNAGKLLLISGSTHGQGYAPGDSLPPHLSPFVEDSPLEYRPSLEEEAVLADSDAELEAEESDQVVEEEMHDSSDNEFHSQAAQNEREEAKSHPQTTASKTKIQKAQEETLSVSDL